MSAIKGSENILYIKRNGGSFEQVGFLTVNSFQSSTDFLSTTTRENAGFNTEVPIEISYTIGFSAIMFEDADLVGKIGYKEILEIQNGFEQVEWKLEAFGKNFVRYGLGYISNLAEESPTGGVIAFDGEIKVYGKILEILDTEPPSTPVLVLATDEQVPGFTLSWGASTDNMGVDYYELRKIKSGSPQEIINVGKVLEYEDTAITYLTYYSYNVRAVDISGNVSPWSNKRLGYALVPSGQPTPEYILKENGQPLLTESGPALIEE